MIRDTLFNMPSNKAPGPDGFTVEFYKAAWDIIGNDFIVAVQSFFYFGLMPKGINSTLLTLIPKHGDAQTIMDYRPIACCNMIYKVISKILANRLKRLLPDFIAPNQSAFIKDRLLLENVLLATELVKNYHKDSISPRSTIKLDISKAFDTIQWSFIIDVLHALHLPDLFIHWIEVCISTAHFSVAVNGELEGFFHSSRGLRQGCPLSPYLFVIASNVLSRLLDRACDLSLIGYHPSCYDPKITHVCFADDIMVFTDGSAQSLIGTLNVLDMFGKISGLRVNPTKCTLFPAGKVKNNLTQAAIQAQLQIGSLPIRYLGLPLTTKSMVCSNYGPLIDRIRGKFIGWSTKFLSYAGRLTLIKSVIASITNFWCSVFRLPAKCLDEIEKLCGRFLWYGTPNGSTHAKISWNDVCCPKNEGGLGIRRLRDVSRVFSFTLIWRLFTLSGSLWVAWCHHYLMKSSSYWLATHNSLGSWIWRKLLTLREEASAFMKVEIGDGKSTSFWYDTWLPMGRIIDITGVRGPNYLGIPLKATVADAATSSCWKIRSSRARCFKDLIDCIHSTQVPNASRGTDRFLWRHGESVFKPKFSAANTWEQIRRHRPQVPWHRAIWFPQAIPRCSFISWLAIHDRLPTGHRMRAWGHNQPCTLCGERDETRDHLFCVPLYLYGLA